MINPKDFENKDLEDLKKVLPKEFFEENTNGKGDEGNNGSNTKVQ